MTIVIDETSNPTFDSLRYLNSWLSMVEKGGKTETIRKLIVWQAINHWDIDRWTDFLVLVFGDDAAKEAQALLDSPPELRDRFTRLVKPDTSEVINKYCKRILEQHHTWLLYDP